MQGAHERGVLRRAEVEKRRGPTLARRGPLCLWLGRGHGGRRRGRHWDGRGSRRGGEAGLLLRVLLLLLLHVLLLRVLHLLLRVLHLLVLLVLLVLLALLVLLVLLVLVLVLLVLVLVLVLLLLLLLLGCEADDSAAHAGIGTALGTVMAADDAQRDMQRVLI